QRRRVDEFDSRQTRRLEAAGARDGILAAQCLALTHHILLCLQQEPLSSPCASDIAAKLFGNEFRDHRFNILRGTLSDVNDQPMRSKAVEYRIKGFHVAVVSGSRTEFASSQFKEYSRWRNVGPI
ncbi:hypothetical protein ACTXT7_013025, partial [Hymenolepis weldensis]